VNTSETGGTRARDHEGGARWVERPRADRPRRLERVGAAGEPEEERAERERPEERGGGLRECRCGQHPPRHESARRLERHGVIVATGFDRAMLRGVVEFDAAVPASERALVAALLGNAPFLEETLRNVLGAGGAGSLRVRPLLGHAGSNKRLYRVETPAGAFVLKHAPRRGFLWLRPRGTFKWREIARLRALSGKGVTPRFGASTLLAGHDAYTEELIDGVTGAEVRDPPRVRHLARMWLTIARLLGRCGPFWRVPGSTMAPGNAMFPKGGGPPVVVDVGNVRWRTPGRIVGKLVASHGQVAAVLDGIEEALGGAGARRFFRAAARQVKDPALQAALRARCPRAPP
jgi:hypothetical protein